MRDAAPSLPSIDARIAELRTQWQSIATGRASFGPGTTADQAARFQTTQLLALTAQRCHERLPSALRGPVDGLASLVGSSPQTTIMTAEAFRPRWILLITTTRMDASVRAIESWLDAAIDRWPRPRVAILRAAATDSTAIATGLGSWRDQVAEDRAEGERDPRIVLDATGGKKSMSVIAGMIAAQHALEVVYIDSQFDASLRMPLPGSEDIVAISLPKGDPHD